jgi:uncharacterized protein (TIGR01370 family)
MSTSPFWTRWPIIGPLLALFTVGASPSPAPSLGPVRSWAVFYGAQADPDDLRRPDLLVLEPDQGWEPDRIRRSGQKILAYLSLGEVNESRPYFAKLKASPGTLAGHNPNWPGAVMVQPGSKVWRSLVLDDLLPSLVARGYDGLFLDTLDTAAYLEREKRQVGAIAAMRRLLADLRARCPEALLVANGGLDLLPEASGSLSAIAVESVFTDYRFKPAAYREREVSAAAVRATELRQVAQASGLPLLVLEYADPQDEASRSAVAQRVREAGFVPFVSDIKLETLRETP